MLLVPILLIRRAGKGFPHFTIASRLLDRMRSRQCIRENPADLVQAVKDVFLFVLAIVGEQRAEDLLKQQEILGCIADPAIRVVAVQSSWVRAPKALARDGSQGAQRKTNPARIFLSSRLRPSISFNCGGRLPVKCRKPANMWCRGFLSLFLLILLKH